MTPEEFAEKMRELAGEKNEYGQYCPDDPERAHGKMDDLMCEVLESLGYGEGVEIFRNTRLWYA